MSSSKKNPASPTAASIARRFGNKAREYERHALLQRETAETLADFAAPEGTLPGTGPVVEVGCGTGLFTSLVAKPGRPYLATDIAPEMVTACQARFAKSKHMHFAIADGQELELATSPHALACTTIVSNLVFQWFANPPAGIVRLSQQASHMAFAILVAGSFPEWHAAFANLGRISGLITLPEADSILEALHASGTARIRQQVLTHTIRYENARAFVESFRGIGADHPRPGYRPTPIKAVLKQFEEGITSTARVLYCLVDRANKETKE